MLTFFQQFFLLVCTIGIFIPQPACAQENQQHLINNGGYIIEDGSGLHKYRENDLFVPASIMKIFTSLVALEFLGPEYRFETHFFLDGQGNLYIKGYGDPLLTSEIVLEISMKLSQMGIRQLLSICLDDTAFDLRGETASEENSVKSYDAPNGALAVNFNAVSLLVGEKGKVSSSESQTPFLPLMQEISVGLTPGLHRLNIDMLPSKPGKPSALRYAGELFSAQLQQAGITIRHPWKTQTTPNNLKPIFIHKSQATLEGIIKDCLKYSNNFIANQLFLACGIYTYGLPATWEKSRQAFIDYSTITLGLPIGLLVMMEGAGLSRQNRISPSTFIQILNRFKPFAPLLSLRETIPLKSGTLTGVYCFAGYFPKGDTLIPFAILLNQTENNRNQLLKELQIIAVGPAAQP
ncbi:MAG: D-alanyl-D-alanine carboxypeptidase [Proteobacteria bacterium]|nr:D-alanyl-D-alanine carboxypeptidase [Pseudomonadota bacterium]